MKEIIAARPSTDELYIFFMQFAAFYSSGESLILAFDSMAKQTENEMLRNALKDIRKAITQGEPLAKSFGKHDFFPKFCVQAIQAGEDAGTLDAALTEIAYHLEQLGEIKKRIQSALLPVKIIASMLMIAVTIMFTIVIPKFQQMYTEMKITLPLITRMVVGTISFFIDYWYIHIIILSLLAYGAYWYKKKYPEKIDLLMLKLPLYKHVYYYVLQYRFAKIFNLLHQAGIEPVKSLEITADAIDNAVVARILRKAAQKIKGGGMEVSKALQECNQEKVIDFLLISFITTGEQTGTMNDLLDKAANYYQIVLKNKIQNFSEKIGPAFLSPMAFLIILVLLAVYYPIFTLTQAIK